jgi:hypothetical protein
MAQIAAAPKIDVKGTYSLYFEYCQPKTGTPAGVFQTVHGLVGNAAYWNVKVEYVLRDRIGVLADWCSGYTDNSFAESAAAAGWGESSFSIPSSSVLSSISLYRIPRSNGAHDTQLLCPMTDSESETPLTLTVSK